MRIDQFGARDVESAAEEFIDLERSRPVPVLSPLDILSVAMVPRGSGLSLCRGIWGIAAHPCRWRFSDLSVLELYVLDLKLAPLTPATCAVKPASANLGTGWAEIQILTYC